MLRNTDETVTNRLYIKKKSFSLAISNASLLSRENATLMNLKLIRKTTPGLLILTALSGSLQAETNPSQDVDLTQGDASGSIVTEVNSLNLPPDILLPAVDPALDQALSLTEAELPELALSFLLEADAAPPESAEAFLQGLGIALALVEVPGGKALAAFDASQGTEGDWLYSATLVSGTESQSIAITFSPDGQSWSVMAGNDTPFTDLPRDLLTLSQPLTFYGNATSDVSITTLSGTYPAEEEDLEQESETEKRFKAAKHLKDFQLSDGGKMTRSGGTLVQARERFAAKMAELPEHIRNLPKEMIIFVDNENGDDRFDGHWPEKHGNRGPKESLAAAVEAVPDGGALILMPGLGLYMEQLQASEGKSFDIVPIGDIDLGQEEDVLVSLNKIHGDKGEALLRKYQKVKARKNEKL